MSPFVLCAAAYVVGSIPFGMLVARAKGVNLRDVGSGNIGATNVARALGKGWAVVVLWLVLLICFAILRPPGATLRDAVRIVPDAIRLVHRVKGRDVPLAALEEAVRLSAERYCSVRHTLDPAMPITDRCEVVEG